MEYKETIADLEVTQEAMGSALAASDEGNAGQASLKSETSFEVCVCNFYMIFNLDICSVLNFSRSMNAKNSRQLLLKRNLMI